MLGLAGRDAEAQRSYRSALTLAAAAGDRYEHARALAGLGTALGAAGGPYLEEAAAISAELGVPALV